MRSITLKLTLTFLAVSLAGVALVAVIIWGTTSLAFNQFLLDRSKSDFLAAATTYYQANGTWDGISEALTKQGLIPAFQPDPNSPPSSQPGSTNPGPPLVTSCISCAPGPAKAPAGARVQWSFAYHHAAASWSPATQRRSASRIGHG